MVGVSVALGVSVVVGVPVVVGVSVVVLMLLCVAACCFGVDWRQFGVAAC